MNRYKLKAFSVASLFIGCLSNINATTPEYWSSMPYFCKSGAVFEGSASANITPEECNGSCDVDYDFDVDFLAAVSHQRLLINGSHRIKGDGAYYVSRNDDIYFYDSLGGYRGFDKSNSEGNAYLTYTFTDSRNHSSGPGQIWVMKDISSSTPMCSKKEVLFQNAPQINNRSQPYSPSDNVATVNVEWIIDQYATAPNTANIYSKISVIATKVENRYATKKEVTITSLTGNRSINLYTPTTGLHEILVRINDGKYEAEKYLGTIYISGISSGGDDCFGTHCNSGGF
ncbi:hypothetical protein [Aliikangiella maris]|uniref:Uncharacterized protein n=2 Tax=Aliikangiella maris TaxID=3162458 RepID=A0ABV2BX10_9GAMM